MSTLTIQACYHIVTLRIRSQSLPCPVIAGDLADSILFLLFVVEELFLVYLLARLLLLRAALHQHTILHSFGGSHDSNDWNDMRHIVRVKLLYVKFLSFLAQIDTFRDQLRRGSPWLLRGHIVCRNLAACARNVRLFLILLDKGNLSHLVTHIFQALFFKFAHERNIALQLLHKEVFLYAVQLALHAQADKLGDVRVRLCNQDVLTADDTAWTEACDLIHAVLLPSRLRAHCLTLAGQLA